MRKQSSWWTRSLELPRRAAADDVVPKVSSETPSHQTLSSNTTTGDSTTPTTTSKAITVSESTAFKVWQPSESAPKTGEVFWLASRGDSGSVLHLARYCGVRQDFILTACPSSVAPLGIWGWAKAERKIPDDRRVIVSCYNSPHRHPVQYILRLDGKLWLRVRSGQIVTEENLKPAETPLSDALWWKELADPPGSWHPAWELSDGAITELNYGQR